VQQRSLGRRKKKETDEKQEKSRRDRKETMKYLMVEGEGRGTGRLSTQLWLYLMTPSRGVNTSSH